LLLGQVQTPSGKVGGLLSPRFPRESSPKMSVIQVN